MTGSSRTVDLAGVSVSLSAGDATRWAMVDDLLGALADDDGPVEACVDFDTRPPAIPDRAPDLTAPDLRVWETADESWYHHAGGLRARADSTRLVVGGESDDPRLGFRRLFHPGAARLLVDRSRYLVHAAAVVGASGAWIVLGGSGAGKSTIAYAAIQAEWPVLADDLVVLSVEGDVPAATGIPRPPSFPGEIFGGHGPFEYSDDPRGRRLAPASVLDRDTYPVAGVLAVMHGDQPAGSLDPLPRSAALTHLVSSFTSATTPGRLAPWFAVAAVVAHLPAFSLAHGSDPDGRVVAAVRMLGALDEPGSGRRRSP